MNTIVVWAFPFFQSFSSPSAVCVLLLVIMLVVIDSVNVTVCCFSLRLKNPLLSLLSLYEL